MFLRKLKNRSGSISVQIISKSSGKYKVVKTIGSGRTEQEIQKLEYLGKQELERLSCQPKLFISVLLFIKSIPANRRFIYGMVRSEME